MDSQRTPLARRRISSILFGLVVAAVGASLAFGIGLPTRSNGASPEPVTAGAPDGEESNDIMEALVARETARPEFLDEEMANASLEALTSNGVLDRIQIDPANISAQDAGRMQGQENAAANADVLVPLVHFIDCEVDTCQNAIDWADQRQLETSDPVLSLGHGGIELYHVEIYQVVPAAGQAIAAQADRIYRGVESLNDTTIRYAGWAPSMEVGR